MIKKILAKFWSLGQGVARDRAYYDALLPTVPFEAGQGIARTIHQTYYRRDLPEDIQSNVKHIRELNPDYEYRLWDDDDIVAFIREHYGEEVLSIYHKIVPKYGAARADLFRYLLIYKLGGVYIDIKSSFDKPLAEVICLNDSCILSHWDNLAGQAHEGWTTQHPGLEDSPRGEYVQWYLVYQAGHPLLREIIIEILSRIESYNPFINSIGRGGVLSTTGPIPYSRAILDHQARYREYIRIAELPDLGFIYSIYDVGGALYKHKTIMPANYWRLTMPLVPSSNGVIQLCSSAFIKLWYMVLDLRWKLSGKEGQRS